MDYTLFATEKEGKKSKVGSSERFLFKTVR
jgi:hypothetical protein